MTTPEILKRFRELGVTLGAMQLAISLGLTPEQLIEAYEKGDGRFPDLPGEPRVSDVDKPN